MTFINCTQSFDGIVITEPMSKKELKISNNQLQKIENWKKDFEINQIPLYYSTKKTGLERRLLIAKIYNKTCALLLFNKTKSEKDLIAGKGSKKLVKYAVDMESGKSFVSLRMHGSLTRVQNEIDNHRMLQDEKGFIQLLAFVEYKTEPKEGRKQCIKVRFIEENCSGGVLHTRHSLKDTISFISQLAEILNTLHTKFGSVYRDLKFQQILLQRDHEGHYTVVLGDLHKICKIQDEVKGKFYGTTAAYTSPELAQSYYSTFNNSNCSKREEEFPEEKAIVPHVTPALDIWSLGCIAYMKLTETPVVWGKKTYSKTLGLLKQIANKQETMPEFAKNCVLGFNTKNFLSLQEKQQELIKMLLEPNPKARASAKTLFEFIQKNEEELWNIK